MKAIQEHPTYRLIVQAPKRVLIVEDDLTVQETLKALCHRTHHGIQVDCVTRVDAAETLLRYGKLYDLAIVDLHLAGNTDGLDLWRSCHDTYPCLNFLFTSAITATEFYERVGGQAAPEFLPKPFSVLECTQVLSGLLAVNRRR